ncbi:putative cytochrome C oxidase assembly protein [Handroanthus impetiginosus]|uniref:Putative cytochrome C oxidase assembly protein n=1 Tax=Handroanthus impetiginosus TaxID=429701 RepID=A0A2G9IAI6_9LAMI|nr:putative cytochrome C oxidase assembly protein [Handroanthus impetiginosus]
MPLYSRIVFSSLKNHTDASQIHRWFGASRRFSSLIFTRSAPTNILLPPVTGQTTMGDPEGLNCFKKFGFSKRYYSSSTRSTNNTKPPFPLPEEAATPLSRKLLVIPGSLLAGIGGLVLFLHYNDEKRAVPKGKGEKFERSAIQGPIIGGPFSLVDTEGHLVTEKNLLGNWVLLYFGYTSSPDVGPAELRKMADTIDILESKQKLKVLPIFVTIDPHRDTPSHLRAYIREFDSRIVGLTGPVAAIRQMAQEYRVFFRKVDEEGDDYLVESSHNMYLMNPNMEVARSFGVEYSAEELAEAITKEMSKTKITVPQS